MSENDEWVHVALTDDAIVAEQIVRLRQEPLLPPRKRKGKAPAPLRPLEQVVKKKAMESPLRASPSTPLSWSEATSVSGGAAEVAEESSHFAKVINSARSESLSAAVTSEGHFQKNGHKRKIWILWRMNSLKFSVSWLKVVINKVDALSRNMMETFTAAAAAASKPASLNQSWQPLVAQDPKYSISQGVACIKLDQFLPNLSSEGARGTSFLLPDLNLPVDESGFEC